MTEKLFEEIRAKKFPNLIITINPHENENTPWQNLWDATEAVLKGKLTT